MINILFINNNIYKCIKLCLVSYIKKLFYIKLNID